MIYTKWSSIKQVTNWGTLYGSTMFRQFTAAMLPIWFCQIIPAITFT